VIQLALIVGLLFNLFKEIPSSLAHVLTPAYPWIFLGLAVSLPVFFLFYYARFLSFLPLIAGYGILTWEPAREFISSPLPTSSLELCFFGFLALLANFRHLYCPAELQTKIREETRFNAGSFGIFIKSILSSPSLFPRIFLVLLFGLCLEAVLDHATNWVQMREGWPISVRGLALVLFTELSVLRKHG
jgi:hypothetical protein